MSIDQQFVEFVIKSLVSNPDAVQIERSVDEKGVLLELTVDPEDLGRVIGKRGATAQSVRTLLRALGTKNDARYNLKIVDNGPERRPAPANDDGGSWGASDDNGTSSNDTTASSDDQAEASSSQSEPEADVAEEQPPEQKADKPSDSAARTRQELADLDDLDV